MTGGHSPSGPGNTGSGGDVVAECLCAAGAGYVFGVSSTGQAPLYDALMRRPGLKLIMAPHEGVAVSMAHGFELASQRSGMLMLPGIGIPGAASNLYNAWKDRSGLVVICDGPSTEFSGRDGFQQLDDWLSVTAGLTKWQCTVDRPDRISELVRRGIKHALTPPRGPVCIRVPANVLAAADIEITAHPQRRFMVDVRATPNRELVETAARLLIEADSPIINAGSEVTRAGAVADLVELAEMLAIPVAQGLSVYCDFPYRHSLFAGFCSIGYPLAVLEADTFLNLGAPMPDPAIGAVAVADTTKVIDARLDSERIASVHPTDVAIAGNVKETIRALIDAISAMTTREWRHELCAERLRRSEAMVAATRDRRRRHVADGWDASPMYGERLCHELDRLLVDDAWVVVETGDRSPQTWMNFGPGAKTLIGPTTGFALGWGVGASLGIKLARPDAQVIALAGDGAFMFGQIESLWTASRYSIPVTVVVFNNRSYDSERGRIHFASGVARTDRSAWRDMSCYLGDPNIEFVHLARAFEIEATSVERPDEIRPALERAFAVNREGRPFLVDAAIAQRGPGSGRNWHPGVTVGRPWPVRS